MTISHQPGRLKLKARQNDSQRVCVSSNDADQFHQSGPKHLPCRNHTPHLAPARNRV